MDVRKDGRFTIAVKNFRKSGNGGTVQMDDSVFVSNGVPVAFTVGDAFGKTRAIMNQTFLNCLGVE